MILDTGFTTIPAPLGVSVTTAATAVGDGTTKTFVIKEPTMFTQSDSEGAGGPVIKPGTVTVVAGSVTGSDQATDSTITGSSGITSTFPTGSTVASSNADYFRGIITVTFSSAPSAGAVVSATYTLVGGQMFNNLVSGLYVIQLGSKIVPSNVVNQASSLPLNTGNVTCQFWYSVDSNGRWQRLIANATLTGGGNLIEAMASSYQFIGVALQTTSGTVASLVNATTLWKVTQI